MQGERANKRAGSYLSKAQLKDTCMRKAEAVLLHKILTLSPKCAVAFVSFQEMGNGETNWTSYETNTFNSS